VKALVTFSKRLGLKLMGAYALYSAGNILINLIKLHQFFHSLSFISKSVLNGASTSHFWWCWRELHGLNNYSNPTNPPLQFGIIIFSKSITTMEGGSESTSDI